MKTFFFFLFILITCGDVVFSLSLFEYFIHTNRSHSESIELFHTQIFVLRNFFQFFDKQQFYVHLTQHAKWMKKKISSNGNSWKELTIDSFIFFSISFGFFVH